MAKAKEAISKTLYDVHPGVAMVEKWIAELEPGGPRRFGLRWRAKKGQRRKRLGAHG
jgi:hypothetical protein